MKPAVVSVFPVLLAPLSTGECNISNTKDRVWPHFQPPRTELKIRRAAEYFWRTSLCLEMWSNTVLSFWYIFSIETKTIVNKGGWLCSPANIKGANKEAKIYVGSSTTEHNILFCAHTLCMNYVTNTFLLVSSSVRSKQLLCFVHGQGQKSEQKHTTKNIVGFYNHSPLLTMLKLRRKQRN